MSPSLVPILRNLYQFPLTSRLHTLFTWACHWSLSWETCTHFHWHHVFIHCSHEPVTGPYPEKLVPISTDTTSSYSVHMSPSLVPILRNLYLFPLPPHLHRVFIWAPHWSLSWETCTYFHCHHLFIKCSHKPVTGPYPEKPVPISTATTSSHNVHMSLSLVPILRNLYPFPLTQRLHTVFTWARHWSLSWGTGTHFHCHHIFIQCSYEPLTGPYPEKLVHISTATTSSYNVHMSPSLVPILRNLYPFAETRHYPFTSRSLQTDSFVLHVEK